MKSFFSLFKNLFKEQKIRKIIPNFTKKDGKKLDNTNERSVNNHNFRDKFPANVVAKSSKDQNSLDKNNVDNTSNKKESFGLG